MGNMIRSFDWAATPAGDPATWPIALKLNVSNLLAADFPMLICWGKNYTQLYNDAFRPILGETKHPRALGINANETFAEIRDTIGPMFAGVLEGKTFGFPDFMVPLNRNGYLENCYFDFSYSPIRNEQGHIGGILVICMETTDKVRAMEQMSIGQQNIRNMVRQAPVGMCIVKGQPLMVEEVNDLFLEIIGKKRSQFKNVPYWVVNAEAAAHYEPITDHVIESGTTYHAKEHEIMLIRQGREEIVHVDFVYEPIKNSDGAVDAIIIVAIDVTEKVLARKKVEESEQQYRLSEQKLDQILSQLPAPVVVLQGPNQIIETTNNALLSFWNKTKEEIFGKSMLEVFPELKSQPFPAQWKHVLETGETITNKEMPVTFNNADGSQRLFYVDYYYQPLTGLDGNRNAILATVIDVTNKVQSRILLEKTAVELQAVNEEMAAANEELVTANEELAAARLQEIITRNGLEEAENKLELAIQSAEMGTWSVDILTDKLVLSDKAKEIHGIPPDVSITLRESLAMIDADDREKMQLTVETAIKQNKPFTEEYRINPMNGTNAKWLKSTGIIINGDDGNVLSVSGTILDITEQKEMEQRKDDFISIASHELKTPVTSLKASLQLLNKMKDSPSPVMLPKLIEQANRSMEKVNSLIEDLLNANRMSAGQLHLNKAIFTVSEMLAGCCNHVRSAGIHELIFQGDKTLKLYADEHQIDQVVVNFVNNAVKYASGSKNIYLITEKVNDLVKVSVKDTGPGIDADMLPNLFSRYYRADYSGKQYSGLGLGLYISAEIIKRHGGEIGVDSEPGKGSTFWFTLPAAD